MVCAGRCGELPGQASAGTLLGCCFHQPNLLTNPEWTMGRWSKDQRMGFFFYRATLMLTWCDILCQRTTFTLLSWPWAPGRKPSRSAQVEDKLIDTWFHRGRWTTDEAAPADLSKAARTRQGPRAESFVYEHGFGAVALSLRPVWLRFNKAFLGLLRYSSSYFSI